MSKNGYSTADIDVLIGERVRSRRLQAKVSQTVLGEALGVTFQQIQKYETGANRVSASRLWDIARALDVPISFFFEGLADGRADAGVDDDILANKEALQLIRAYYAMPEAQRRQIFELARVLSDAA